MAFLSPSSHWGGLVMGPRVGLLDVGAFLPERVMTNDEWKEYVDTSDEWIFKRTGIRRRRVAAPGQTTADLAAGAARVVLERTGLQPADVDEIIVATDTPEMRSPDTAAFVQHLLGARHVPTYDLAGSGCAGFVQALDIARSRVLSGTGRVLVIGVEVLTRVMNWRDRNTSVLLGDAAGAAIVTSGEAVAEMLAVASGTDGSKAEILGLPVGGTRRPFSPEIVQEGLHQLVAMNGREVFKEAVRWMSEASRQVLAKAGKTCQDLALVIPHQANLRILKAVAEELQLPEEKLFVNIQEYGNTASASVPLALFEARQQGRISRGDLVLLTAFGAGFHWAAMLLRF
jgi:3-oxoacyl-[acyl-carrier-protein] synthase-3